MASYPSAPASPHGGGFVASQQPPFSPSGYGGKGPVYPQPVSYPATTSSPQQQLVVVQPSYTYPVSLSEAVKTGKWDHGMLDCFSDIGNCLYVCLCPTCAMGDIGANMGHGWCSWCLCGWWQGLAVQMLRLEIMDKRGIPHEPCCGCAGEGGEGCRLFWCKTCAVCQMRHESSKLKADRIRIMMQQRPQPVSPQAMYR